MIGKTLTRYAVRHIPTGWYLPDPGGRAGRGGSHVEPTAFSELDEPRMFISARAAKIYLSTWLRGKFTADRYHDDFSGEYEESIHLEPQPHRNRDEMEIVRVTVTFP